MTSERRIHALAALGLALGVLVVLGDLLLLPGDHVLSSPRGDVAYYFARIRAFAVEEMLRGNLPLWNPYIFSGTPLLGGFQAALLYPPNLIYAVLPLAKAIDLDAAFHVFLTGFFSFAWVRNRGVGAPGAFFAGALASFCGAAWLRVYAGQLTLVAANAWTPLVWLAVDRLLARPDLGWCLIGIAAATLQILAGYPFASFATALVAAGIVVVDGWRAPRRARSAAALAALALAPLLISAAQLWTGLATGEETTRGGGVPFAFATTYSLPFEALLTTLVPPLFGDLERVEYWGRWWFWDTGVFLGAGGLALAALGAHYGPRRARRVALVFAAILLLIAFGSNTPLFGLLYRLAPGFDRFRAPSKFAFQASLFVALLAGMGFEHLRRDARGARVVAALAAGLGLLALGAGLWIRAEAFAEPDAGAWGELVFAINPWLESESFSRDAAALAASGLGLAAAACGVLALLLALRPRRPCLAWAVAGLGLVELLAFARVYRGGFALADLERPKLAAFYAAHPGTDRFFVYDRFDRAQDNLPISEHVLSIWGYDPVQLARYTRFLMFLRDGELAPETPGLAELPRELHPSLGLVRCRYGRPLRGPTELPSALPRFLLLGEYRVLSPEAVLPALVEPDFDPRRTVLLEEEPDPRPTPAGAGGRVSLLGESTDHLDLEVELEAPALLLISDAYSRGWRAVALGSGAQERYQVLPADSVLRAIPLAAGRHRLRVEYAPAAWRVGRWVSGVSAALFMGALLWAGWRRRSRRRALPRPGAPAGAPGPAPPPVPGAGRQPR
jgi:hypothetical protein